MTLAGLLRLRSVAGISAHYGPLAAMQAGIADGAEKVCPEASGAATAAGRSLGITVWVAWVDMDGAVGTGHIIAPTASSLAVGKLAQEINGEQAASLLGTWSARATECGTFGRIDSASATTRVKILGSVGSDPAAAIASLDD